MKTQTQETSNQAPGGRQQNRRDRSKALEKEVHAIFRDRTISVTDRAEKGVELLTAKLTEDIEAEHAHLCELQNSENATAVDHEICRLLRMLEKRRQFFDKIEATLAVAS